MRQSQTGRGCGSAEIQSNTRKDALYILMDKENKVVIGTKSNVTVSSGAPRLVIPGHVY